MLIWLFLLFIYEHLILIRGEDGYQTPPIPLRLPHEYVPLYIYFTGRETLTGINSYEYDTLNRGFNNNYG